MGGIFGLPIGGVSKGFREAKGSLKLGSWFDSHPTQGKSLNLPWSLHVQNRESNHNSEFFKPYRLFKEHSPYFLYLVNLIFTLSLSILKITQSNYRNIRADSAYL